MTLTEEMISLLTKMVDDPVRNAEEAREFLNGLRYITKELGTSMLEFGNRRIR